ncbi:MAG: 3-dehydroquinate synthase [Thermodesulfobacteriota bacterium]
MAREITVGLGERSYRIFIGSGLLQEIGRRIKGVGAGKRYALVADDRVAELFSASILSSCYEAGVAVTPVTFPHGEEQKHLATVAGLASQLARAGFDRKDAVIALGGGVTGDIAGFLAAIYMRGIPFIQIPTTLLAQVDSSVGGKTGVDIPEGKNLVGVFYQPRAVFIDNEVLAPLPDGEFKNGLAEVIKYGVIADADLFAFLEKKRTAILARDRDALEEIVATSCAIKARVVEADEREGGLRRILNFGHTLGHAVEAASGYSLAHGMGVAMGMAAVARIAVMKGIMAPADADRLLRLLVDYGMPVTVPPAYDRRAIKRYLLTDKKTVAGRPFFVLPETIGRVRITDEVDEESIDLALAATG